MAVRTWFSRFSLYRRNFCATDGVLSANNFWDWMDHFLLGCCIGEHCYAKIHSTAAETSTRNVDSSQYINTGALSVFLDNFYFNLHDCCRTRNDIDLNDWGWCLDYIKVESKHFDSGLSDAMADKRNRSRLLNSLYFDPPLWINFRWWKLTDYRVPIVVFQYFTAIFERPSVSKH